MSVMIKGVYKGKKRVELTHEQSGTAIITDAPLDNNGEGGSFSPTDLCASSLASCILTTMAIKAELSEMADFSSAHFTCEKVMESNPRRISLIKVSLHLPKSLDERSRKVLEAVGNACPVHHSLSDAVQKEIEYLYDVE